ncbi:MAG TPA: O-antigen ligase family protein [Gaiellaceae bacterium]
MTNRGTGVGPGRWRAEPGTSLGVLFVLVWVAWAFSDGGFFPTAWGPGGEFLLLLVAVALVATRSVPAGGDRTRVVALASGAAFVAWNFLSIVWAGSPGDAWAGADKTALYLLPLGVFATLGFTLPTLRSLLAVYVVGIAIAGATVIVRAAASNHPIELFVAGRLDSPVGYVDGDVALWMSAFWPAVYLGSTRALPPLLRPLFLGCGGFLLELALLGQSRAWLFLLPIFCALYLLLARQRLRAVGGLAAIAVATLAALQPLLDVFRRYEAGRSLAPAVHHAVWAIALSSIALAAAGAAWTALDSRVSLRRRTHRAVALAAALACIAALGAGSAVAYERVHHPEAWVASRWDEFTSGSEGPAGSSRFTGSLGANLYQEWTVAWREWELHPWAGIGTDNFAAAFLLQRTDSEHEPLYPHSFELRVASQLGIVGFALIAVTLACLVRLALCRRRRSADVDGGAAGAAVMVFAYWLVHGSVDWFWEIPALAAPAIGFLALAGARDPGRAPSGSDGPGPRSRAGIAWRAAGAAVAVAATGAVAFPWLSYAYADAGVAVWRSDRALAYSRLERAAALDPLSTEPLLLEGSIALSVGDGATARRAFLAVLRREPESWYAHFQLGLLAGSESHFGEAAAELREARRLDPLDPVVADALDRVDGRRRLDPNALNRYYLQEVNRRLGQTVVAIPPGSGKKEP